jgi:hypothetical protein
MKLHPGHERPSICTHRWGIRRTGCRSAHRQYAEDCPGRECERAGQSPADFSCALKRDFTAEMLPEPIVQSGSCRWMKFLTPIIRKIEPNAIHMRLQSSTVSAQLFNPNSVSRCCAGRCRHDNLKILGSMEG